MARKTVRVFLDSNVIISGLISDRGAPRIILDVLSVRIPWLSGLTGRFNLIEVERVLSRKLPGALSVYHELLPKLNLEVIPLPADEELDRFRGVIADKDVPVIVSAIMGKAEILVTGDNKDFGKVRERFFREFRVEIVSPSEFINGIAERLRHL